ncbi:MAG: hypothetical protein C5B51_12835 [Terriglobia bacterium]|nr:MAG: hypothetical protein C5B51_12835 [Terriglobia bacterium]
MVVVFPRLVALIVPVLVAPGCCRTRWAAYYSDRVEPEALRDYRLLIFDSDRHPPLAPLAGKGRTVLGYLSLGEVNQHREYFAGLQNAGALAGENPNWPGSYYVDVRDTGWRELVVRQLVPAILAQGFHGLFLDTLDDPAELERRDPNGCRGMTAAAADLVKALRAHYPSIPLMMNRGYELLPQLANHIDIELGESLYSTYDFGRKSYGLVKGQDYKEQVGRLKEAKRRNPHLRIFSLDYWDPSDRRGIRRIYREERANGFEPYVATIGLDQIVKEPR